MIELNNTISTHSNPNKIILRLNKKLIGSQLARAVQGGALKMH